MSREGPNVAIRDWNGASPAEAPSGFPAAITACLHSLEEWRAVISALHFAGIQLDEAQVQAVEEAATSWRPCGCRLCEVIDGCLDASAGSAELFLVALAIEALRCCPTEAEHDGIVSLEIGGSDLMAGDFVWSVASSRPGALLCDGALYYDAAYPALAAALSGTVHDNGDGTFNVPDMRGRTMIGAGSGPGLSTRDVGDTGGEEEHELTISEMPVHSHPRNYAGLDEGVLVGSGTGPFTVVTPGSHSYVTRYWTGDAGAGMGHENMQPFGVGRCFIVF